MDLAIKNTIQMIYIPTLPPNRRQIYSAFIFQLFLSLLFIHVCFSSQNNPTLCQKILRSFQEKNFSELNSTLQQIQEKIYQPCLLELIPKYFWAQNMTHLLVKFQFLNSADTSACDQVLSVKKYVEHNEFYVSLICMQSTLLIRYRISVKTFMPMNYYHAQWRTSQQNTIILVAPKSPNPYFWKRLYLANQTPMRKPKIWWKMLEKYHQNLKKFIYDLEVEDEEYDISGYVKKKKLIKKTKNSEFYNPQSHKYLYCNQNNPFQLGSWLN